MSSVPPDSFPALSDLPPAVRARLAAELRAQEGLSGHPASSSLPTTPLRVGLTPQRRGALPGSVPTTPSTPHTTGFAPAPRPSAPPLTSSQTTSGDNSEGDTTPTEIRVSALEEDVRHLKRYLPQPSEGAGSPGSKRSRLQESERRILSAAKSKLGPAQLDVREKLQDNIREMLEQLTGIDSRKSIFPERPVDDTNDTADEEAASEESAPPASRRMYFDFTGHVSDMGNNRIVKRVATLVWNEQKPDSPSRNLPHEDVTFTIKDLEHFAKENYRHWRVRYQNLTSPRKAKKRNTYNKKSRRLRRKEHARETRESVVDEYRKRYPEDPLPYLDDASFMSDEVSELDTDDEERKNTHRALLAARAGVTPEDIRTGKVQVWERRRPAYRSSEGNLVMDRLDGLRAEKVASDISEGKAKLRPTVRRITATHKNPAPPTSPVYLFMLDPEWYRKYMDEHSGHASFVLDGPESGGTVTSGNTAAAGTTQ